MFDPKLLATGGLFALVAAGWQQVKTIAQYAKGILIVQASVDIGLTHPVRVLLKQRWKPVPNGMLVYVSRCLMFKNRKNSVNVPFRVASRNSIYYLGFRFLSLSITENGATLTAIRGFIDFDKLISDALDMEVDRHENINRKSSNFFVDRVIGSEKGFHARTMPHGGVIDATESPVQNKPNIEPGIALDVSVDESFKYPKDLYSFDEQDPFRTLYFPQEVLRYVEQAEQWLNMGAWYTERNIPWRRGWLLHGPGGTGKSSLSKAVAQKLRIPIYQYYLATLSDQEFIRRWEQMNTPCVALFEDFDNVFDKREPLTEHKSLTFDCVLNQISGVSSLSGVFLIVTTNHLDKIDPALGVACGRDGISTRPGRIDSVIRLGEIEEADRLRMAQQILRDWPEDIPDMVAAGQGTTPIQFQEQLIQYAYHRLSSNLKEHNNGSNRATNNPRQDQRKDSLVLY